MVRGAGVFFFLATGLTVASAGHAPCNRWQQARDCKLEYGPVKGSFYPFLVNQQGAPGLLYPETSNGKQTITLPSNSKALVACPGDGNKLKDISQQPQDLSVTCRDSHLVRNDNGQAVQWDKLRCKQKLTPKVKKAGTCYKGYNNLEIMWTTGPGFSLPQITTCYNSGLQAAVYSSHTINGRIIASRWKAGKDSDRCFKLDGTEDVGCRAYTDGNKSLRDRKIIQKGSRGFDRGHLAPYADFMMDAEQVATNYLINAAPQWNRRNGGSWRKVEEAVRERADLSRETFDVYTGTFGILKHQGSELFMKDTDKKLPIPELFWKVVHNTDRNTCVSFVAFNAIDDNPVIWTPPCNNICYLLDNWNHILQDFSARQDKTICCSVDDLFNSKIIPDYLPCHNAPLLK